MVAFFLFVAGFIFGSYERKLRDSIEELKKPKEAEPEVGATPASYGHVNQYAANQSEIGISEPKSPQLLEWEEQLALQKMQEDVKVKPRR